ncbi:MAG: sec-independent protein translocase protein TatA [Sphingobacteriales bacterium]
MATKTNAMNTTLLFMGLGMQEILLILLVLILLFGAKKIPELAKGLGKGIREFKDASSNVKKDIEKSMNDDSSEDKKS